MFYEYEDKDKEKLCVQCYEGKYGEENFDTTLEITRAKDICDCCKEKKNIVIKKIEGFYILR